jgi:hypothetical protein
MKIKAVLNACLGIFSEVLYAFALMAAAWLICVALA